MAYLSKFKIRCLILTSIIAMLIAYNSYAHTYKKMNVEIIHPWCSAGVKGDNTVCYITISNDSDKDIELKDIDSDSIHHIMLMKNGKSVDKILIKGNGGIRGEDDFSIMLHGLKHDLITGGNSPAILKFSSGMTIDIKFVIGENTTLDEGSGMDNTQEHHDHSNH